MENDFYSIECSAETYYHKINIFGSLENNKEYRDLFLYLMSISKSDKVKILLGSNGGDVEVTQMLANGIRNCSADVEILVTMPCYSSAAVLALCGDSLIMEENTFLMFHNQSCGYDGKHNASMKFMEANEKHYSFLLQNKCYPFLTKQEIKQVLNDKDLYIHADDASLQKRLDRHFGVSK